MAAMNSFDYILNWKLKQGSHVFPGKDGGTCINEAAVSRPASHTGQSVPLMICQVASRIRSAAWQCT